MPEANNSTEKTLAVVPEAKAAANAYPAACSSAEEYLADMSKLGGRIPSLAELAAAAESLPALTKKQCDEKGIPYVAEHLLKVATCGRLILMSEAQFIKRHHVAITWLRDHTKQQGRRFPIPGYKDWTELKKALFTLHDRYIDELLREVDGGAKNKAKRGTPAATGQGSNIPSPTDTVSVWRHFFEGMEKPAQERAFVALGLLLGEGGKAEALGEKYEAEVVESLKVRSGAVKRLVQKQAEAEERGIPRAARKLAADEALLRKAGDALKKSLSGILTAKEMADAMGCSVQKARYIQEMGSQRRYHHWYADGRSIYTATAWQARETAGAQTAPIGVPQARIDKTDVGGPAPNAPASPRSRGEAAVAATLSLVPRARLAGGEVRLEKIPGFLKGQQPAQVAAGGGYQKEAA